MAADIEPREMVEGKTEELENMANICFNLPKKTDKCFKFTDISPRFTEISQKITEISFKIHGNFTEISRKIPNFCNVNGCGTETLLF